MVRVDRTVLRHRTYSVDDLYNARLEAARRHRCILSDGDAGVDEIGNYINGLAGGQIPYQLIAQKMKEEGNYPWSDNEIANFALSSEIDTPRTGQIEEFAGRHYAWDFLEWCLVDDFDFSDDTFIRAKVTYGFFDLMQARDQVEKLTSDPGVGRLLADHEERTRDACARLRKVEQTMKREGVYPWTEEERANIALASLPPNNWGVVHYFNGRPYIRKKRVWVLDN